MKRIDKQLKACRDSNHPHIVRMIDPMQTKFDKYWSKMKDFAAVNQVFDPRCKLERIQFILSDELGESQATAQIKYIKDLLATWFNESISKKKNQLLKLHRHQPAFLKRTSRLPT
jgi:hypothetical protein